MFPLKNLARKGLTTIQYNFCDLADTVGVFTVLQRVGMEKWLGINWALKDVSVIFKIPKSPLMEWYDKYFLGIRTDVYPLMIRQYLFR